MIRSTSSAQGELNMKNIWDTSSRVRNSLRWVNNVGKIKNKSIESLRFSSVIFIWSGYKTELQDTCRCLLKATCWNQVLSLQLAGSLCHSFLLWTSVQMIWCRSVCPQHPEWRSVLMTSRIPSRFHCFRFDSMSFWCRVHPWCTV